MRGDWGREIGGWVHPLYSKGGGYFCKGIEGRKTVPPKRLMEDINYNHYEGNNIL